MGGSEKELCSRSHASRAVMRKKRVHHLQKKEKGTRTRRKRGWNFLMSAGRSYQCGGRGVEGGRRYIIVPDTA